jgi:hypothetical protein
MNINRFGFSTVGGKMRFGWEDARRYAEGPSAILNTLTSDL